MFINAKLADTLRTMPAYKESAFAIVAPEHVDLGIFVRRYGNLPDGDMQIYSLNDYALERLAAVNHKLVATFEYTLCVSPMAATKIFAVVLSSSTPTGPEAVTALHAPEYVHLTPGNQVYHFVDQQAMRRFVVRIGA